MSNMSYCRHENTANDLADVLDRWDDFNEEEATQFELNGRLRIIRMVRELNERFEEEGIYDDIDA